MKIAVVGAGWAGLAAASQCLAHGMTVTLYDASHTTGGRARGVTDATLGELDNGQHLFIGAYNKTLALIARDLGKEHLTTAFKRIPLWLQSANGQFRLKRSSNAGTRALADACALWFAQGLSLTDKWQITAFLRRLQTSPSVAPETPGLTVSQWLASESQTANACRWLWHPLCIATLNTAPSEACARLFRQVLLESFLSTQSDATDLLIPTQNLSDLWPSALADKLTARWGHVVRSLEPTVDGVIIDGVQFDGCVLAVPPPNLVRLTTDLPIFDGLTRTLAEFRWRSIATCYVAVENHKSLPAPLLMFDHHHLDEHNPAQWVFDRTAFMHSPVKAQLAFVISCADDLVQQDDLGMAKRLIDQLNRATQNTHVSKILGARCFREKRATFAALPGLKRPLTQTAHRHIVLAGDWTNTGYPSVIEGAVTSGIMAADRLATLSERLD